MTASSLVSQGTRRSSEDSPEGPHASVTPPRTWPFWAVTALIFTAMTASSTPSPLYGLYQQKWHFSAVTTTLIYACYAMGAVAVLTVAGSLRAHIGTKRVLVMAAVALGVSFLLFLCATGTGALYTARTVQGMGIGLLTSSAGAALTHLHPRKNPHAAAVVNSAVTSIGIALGAVLSGLAAAYAPAPLALPFFILSASTSLLLFLILLIPQWESGQSPLRTWRPRPLMVRGTDRGMLLRESLTIVVGWSVAGLYLALGVELTASVMSTQNRASSSLIILIVQGAGGTAPLIWKKLNATRAALSGCLSIVAGLAISVVGITGPAAVFFVGAAVTGSGFGLTFMGSLRRVSAAALDGDTISAFYAIAYIAVSVPIIAVGVIESLVGLQGAFICFGGIVTFLAASAVVVTCTSARRVGEQNTQR
ncbi:MFS transporter [Streptomyces sp. NPDC026665]|uniref:MFS transporter n=1 Tax=Streptomyces sp. NPDC026665 TaxID=3154798 RepID=UPI00340CC794